MPYSAHHLSSRTFCSAVTPLRINFKIGVLRLSMPGCKKSTPASRRSRTCSRRRLDFVS
jgi:hypothetical protein